MARQELTAFPAKGEAKANPIMSKVKQDPGRLPPRIRVDRASHGAIHGQDEWLTDLVCDGKGTCVGCTDPSQCPGDDDNECLVPTCEENQCGFSFVEEGTPLKKQTDGDCKIEQCDGAGKTKEVIDNTDVPVDNNDCTDDICTAGLPSNPPLAAGETCSGGVCDGDGTCVECLDPKDCGATTECRWFTCENNKCQPVFAPENTVLTNQIDGDCQRLQCNAVGEIVSVNDDNDLPDDDNPCTENKCEDGKYSHPPVAAGEPCGNNLVCDGEGKCVGCNSADDCEGNETFCKQKACVAGVCGFEPINEGTELPTGQEDGNCLVWVCEDGDAVEIPDDADVLDDGTVCTINTCSDGDHVVTSADEHTPCSEGGGKACDGKGHCAQCTQGTHCPSSVCIDYVCRCDNGKKDGDETDIDCGGSSCAPCKPEQACLQDTDCETGQCVSQKCGWTTVLSTIPADGASGVAVDTNLVITFSSPMTPASLTAQTTAGACSGTIQVSSNSFADCVAFKTAAPAMSGQDAVATLELETALTATGVYKLRVLGTAKDALGNDIEPFLMTYGFTADINCLGQAIVISQAYGGGGNSGATYTHDFIELHNRGAMDVDLTGWSVQFASATGTTWQVTPLTGTIAAGGYFLIQQAKGTGGTTSLPDPDAIGTSAMGAENFKIALVRNSTALTGACPNDPAIADFVGVGTANCFEGTVGAKLSNTTAALRKDQGCTETDDNAADFEALAPTPRNTKSPIVACSCSANETDEPYEIDYCVLQHPASVTVVKNTTTESIYGRIFETGLTEAAGSADRVLAQLGWGPTSVNPSAQSGFQYVNATFNVQAGNDDEYAATISPEVAGTYSYVYRFSIDGGAHWTYCDLDGAGSNASLSFDPALLGELTVTD